MAKGRKVNGDQHSEEFDELRRNFHSLLHMLETAAASVTAGATAEVILTTWAEGIAAGRDSNPASTALVVSSGREVLGVVPVVKQPPRPRAAGSVLTLSATDKSI